MPRRTKATVHTDKHNPGSRVIRVDEEVYQFLKDRAEPLSETPNNSIRRILGITTGTVEWSFQARLRRLAVTLETEGRVGPKTRKELKSILEAHYNGLFNA